MEPVQGRVYRVRVFGILVRGLKRGRHLIISYLIVFQDLLPLINLELFGIAW